MQVKKLLAVCPRATGNGSFSFDHRGLDAIIALGVFYLESGLQVVALSFLKFGLIKQWHSNVLVSKTNVWNIINCSQVVFFKFLRCYIKAIMRLIIYDKLGFKVTIGEHFAFFKHSKMSKSPCKLDTILWGQHSCNRFGDWFNFINSLSLA